MSKGKFNYYSDQYEEALIQELIQELGFNKKTDFFNTILYGKRINIGFTDTSKTAHQEIGFKPNEEQLRSFDSFFTSTYSKADSSKIDTSNCKTLDDYIALIKTVKPTHIEYVNLCLEAFGRVLNQFDFDIATPSITKLSDESELIKSINKKVLKAVNKKGKRTQKTPTVDDIDSINKEVNSHPKNNLDKETESVIRSCFRTIKLIKNLEKDNEKVTMFNSTINKIEKTISSLSNPKKQYTNFDFLIEKLLDLNIYTYSNSENQLKIITPFLENMSYLNKKIRDCHIQFNNKKSTKNDNIKSAYELRKTLFTVLEKQEHLLNQFY